jgi:hypothetical protein
LATPIFPVTIIAAKARLASAPPAAIASVDMRGVICQEIPQRSLHQLRQYLPAYSSRIRTLRSLKNPLKPASRMYGH